MPLEIQDGRIIGVAATGGCTAGNLWAGTEAAGVYLDTYAAASTNTNVPVAVAGVFTVPKHARTANDFAVGEFAYTLTTGGAIKAVSAAATGASTTIRLGFAVEAATTTATTVKVCVGR